MAIKGVKKVALVRSALSLKKLANCQGNSRHYVYDLMREKRSRPSISVLPHRIPIPEIKRFELGESA